MTNSSEELTGDECRCARPTRHHYHHHYHCWPWDLPARGSCLGRQSRLRVWEAPHRPASVNRSMGGSIQNIDTFQIFPRVENCVCGSTKRTMVLWHCFKPVLQISLLEFQICCFQMFFVCLCLQFACRTHLLLMGIRYTWYFLCVWMRNEAVLLPHLLLPYLVLHTAVFTHLSCSVCLAAHLCHLSGESVSSWLGISCFLLTFPRHLVSLKLLFKGAGVCLAF